MTETFTRWDPVDELKTEADQTMYLNACLDEDPGDGSLVRAALGDIARARGMSQLARDTDISRERLYRAGAVAMLTVRNLPNDVHRALLVRVALHVSPARPEE